MKYLFTIFMFTISFCGMSQDGADRITFSKFDKPKDLALIDTVKGLLLAGSYGSFISEEKEVYNKASATRNFSAVKNILQNLSNNGSDDISECFYPQHSINFYKGDKIVKYVLICFDCYGVRFSDERWITKVRNEKKRIDLMQELRTHFQSNGLQ